MSEQTFGATRRPPAGLHGLPSPPPNACGILNPGLEGRIVRPDGSDAEIDEPGELWVRGASITHGYWNNEKATRETYVNGWLHTGDYFKIDKIGFL